MLERHANTFYSKSVAFGRGGSSPPTGTIEFIVRQEALFRNEWGFFYGLNKKPDTLALISKPTNRVKNFR